MEDTKCIFILTKVIKFHFSVLVICTICMPTASEAGCKVYNSTHVDCTYRGLTAVPSNLPSSTTHLDLSHNEITRLQPGCLENLHSLEELIIYTSKDLIIDVNAFKGLHNLRSLSFPGAGSVIFNKGTFRHLSRLQTLEIKIKTYSNVTGDLFSDLINLSKLTIRGPVFPEWYSPAVFRGLKNLEELNVHGTVGSSFADLANKSFKELVRLELMLFDFVSLKCDNIEKLRPLKNIEVMSFNDITTGTFCNFTFSQFPRLKQVFYNVFYIDARFSIFDWSKNCSDLGAVTSRVEWDNNEQEAGTLPPLSPYNISYLVISSLHMDGQFECYLKNGLRNVAIDSLRMVIPRGEVNDFTETTFEGLARSDIQEMDIRLTLDKIATNTFQGLTRLKSLYMHDCNLRDGAFVSLNASPTLITLSLAGNKFKNFKQFLSALAQLNNLRYIDFSRNMFTGKIPKKAFWNYESLTYINLGENKFNDIDPESFSFLSNLQYLDLSYNEFELLSTGAFHGLKSLETLLLVGNSLRLQEAPGYFIHPFKNLYNLTMLTLSTLRLESIDLEDTPRLENLHIDNASSPQFINKALFPENLLLKHLTVLIVKNTEFVSLDRGRVIINTEVLNVQPRQFLSVLELENNNFNELNFTSLNEFRSLVKLSVANNKLTFIYGVPDKLDKLESFDLSGNLIAVLSSEILTHLPSLNIVIIYENPFDCSCKMKPFQDWLRKDEKSNVDFGGGSTLHSTCSLPQVKYGIPINMVEFGFECDLVLLIVLPVTCFIMVIVIIALVHRFHWHIRFAYFLIKRRLGGYQLKIDDEDQPINKRYDAFVVYNKHDSDWVIHELLPNLENIDPPNFRLCIHERDFLPGNDIFENILDSIENSKKTMLILSPDFAASEWCYFEMRMAQNCLFEEKRDIIVMVSLKKNPR